MIEVSRDKKGTKVLEKYLKWGKENGLQDEEINLLTKSELNKIEPEIKCDAALQVYRDASTDYSVLTKSLMNMTSRASIAPQLQNQWVS